MRNTFVRRSRIKESTPPLQRGGSAARQVAAFGNLHSIVIPHIAPHLTKMALKYACHVPKDHDSSIRLIDVCVVPYGRALGEAANLQERLRRKLEVLTKESSFPISAEVICARDWERGFQRALSPASVVVIAMNASSWRTSRRRMAERLRRLGHHVIWVVAE